MPTVADAIAAFLEDKNVRHAFGIIGAGNVALFEAIAKRGFTQIVCCHHEQAAVMAATFAGRVTQSCGVAIVTTGAGSSNAITGALAAHMDSAPVLIISGNEPSRYLLAAAKDYLGRRVVGVQGYITSDVAEHVTKYAWTAVRNGANCLLGVRYSFKKAQSERPGPVWIDIARNLFNEPV